jgi:hypothetical protein
MAELPIVLRLETFIKISALSKALKKRDIRRSASYIPDDNKNIYKYLQWPACKRDDDNYK